MKETTNTIKKIFEAILKTAEYIKDNDQFFAQALQEKVDRGDTSITDPDIFTDREGQIATPLKKRDDLHGLMNKKFTYRIELFMKALQENM